jgi:hypothetical protein
MVFEPLSMNLREVLKKYGKNVGLHIKAVRWDPIRRGTGSVWKQVFFCRKWYVIKMYLHNSFSVWINKHTFKFLNNYYLKSMVSLLRTVPVNVASKYRHTVFFRTVPTQNLGSCLLGIP